MHNTEEYSCRNQGAEGVKPPPDFDISINPISTRWTKSSPPHFYLPPPPGFLDLPTALHNTEEDPYLLELVRILTQKKKDIFHT